MSHSELFPRFETFRKLDRGSPDEERRAFATTSDNDSNYKHQIYLREALKMIICYLLQRVSEVSLSITLAVFEALCRALALAEMHGTTSSVFAVKQCVHCRCQTIVKT